jgi:hypothetical protein
MLEFQNWPRWLRNGLTGVGVAAIILLVATIVFRGLCPTCGANFITNIGFFRIYPFAFFGGFVGGQISRKKYVPVLSGIVGTYIGYLTFGMTL